MIRNRTLSLVCKRWYEIIWNSTSFWTNVVLRPTWDISKLESICRFARSCHQRTKGSLLDVVMDFSNVLPFRIYLGRVLDEHLKRFPFFNPYPVLGFADEAEARRVNYQDLDDHHSSLKRAYDAITKEVMNNLMEQNKKHIRRWRSLHIAIPPDLECGAVHTILHEMTGYLENLVNMFIMGTPDNGIDTLEEVPSQLPYFPNLRSLKTNQNVTFDQIHVNHATLTHISLNNPSASSHFINERQQTS